MPTAAGGANWRVNPFHLYLSTARLRACPVSPGYLSCKSLSDCGKRSNLYFQLIIARTVLSVIRAGQLEGS